MDKDLARAPRGLRFADPDMERRFAVSYIEELRPLLLAGHVAALAAWIVALALVVALFPAQRTQGVAIVFAAMSALGLGFHQALRGRTVSMSIVVIGNAIAGLATVQIGSTLDVRDLYISGPIIVLFFATAIYRLPLRWSIAATAPYVLYAQALVIADPAGLEVGGVVVQSAALWIAELSGLLSCVISEVHCAVHLFGEDGKSHSLPHCVSCRARGRWGSV